MREDREATLVFSFLISLSVIQAAHSADVTLAACCPQGCAMVISNSVTGSQQGALPV